MRYLLIFLMSIFCSFAYGGIDAGDGRIINVSRPIDANDACTKDYADDVNDNFMLSPAYNITEINIMDWQEAFINMLGLEEDTKTDVIIGPLVNYVDGKTPVTACDINDVNCAVYKNVTRVEIPLTVSNFVHIADGYWKLTLTSAHTDTVGYLLITLRDDDVILPYRERLSVK